jgi:hypothetical protein
MNPKNLEKSIKLLTKKNKLQRKLTIINKHLGDGLSENGEHSADSELEQVLKDACVLYSTNIILRLKQIDKKLEEL